MDFNIAELYNVFDAQQGKDSNCQKQVLKLIQFLSSEDGWPLCTSMLLNSNSNLPNVDALPDDQKSALFFLCCRALEENLKSDSPVPPDEAPKFAAFACQWLRYLINPVDGIRKPKYFESKAGHLVTLAIIRYYPNHWSSLFDDLLGILIEATGKQVSESNKSDIVAVDLFLDILIDLDSHIISRNVQLTTEELKRSNELKDAMRESCIGSLIHTCYQLIYRFLSSCQSNACLIRKILHTIGLYASWVDLTLVANTEWITLLSRLLQLSMDNESSSAVIRCGIYLYLIGFVNKGMPVIDKLSLLTGVWEQLGSMLINDPNISNFMMDSNVNSCDDLNDDQLESLSTLGTLIDAMGNQLISVYRNLYDTTLLNSGSNQTSTNQFRSDSDNSSFLSTALEALEDRLNVALRLFEHKKPEISQVVTPFLRSYLSLLKSVVNHPSSENLSSSLGARRQRNRNSSASMDSGNPLSVGYNTSSGHLEINEIRYFFVKRLLFACIDKMKYLPIHDDQEDDECEYEEYRHELRTIVGNISQLDQRFVLDAIHQMVRHSHHLLNSNAIQKSSFPLDHIQQIDVTLNLFYLFGEICKANKNDHFSQTFPHHETMISIMSILCTDSFSRLPHETLQLQYFEIMVRYERYFSLVPEHLLHVMLAFVDDRGLHSPWHSVKIRCAYLINRIIKSHKKTLLPHTEEYLSRFSDLLELSLEPDCSVLNSSELNGSITCINGRTTNIRKFNARTGLGITEQSFLYEAAAQLIAAGGIQLSNLTNSDNSNNGEDRVGELFRVLLTPVMIQYDQFVTKYITEQDPKVAEVRGILVKQVTDLITKTTRVFSQPKCIITSGCESVLIDAMRLIISELSRFPTDVTSPGRQAACAGVRAFLHRMVACIMPATEPSSTECRSTLTSDVLLAALVDAIPQLVKPLLSRLACYTTGSQMLDVFDAEQRWKEIRDLLPLVTQVVLRYKNQSVPFLSSCLPDIMEIIINSLNEPLPPDHPTLIEERKLLRRGYLQLVQTIYQSVPDVFSQLTNENIVQNLTTVLGQVEACLESDDPIGLRSGIILFLQLIQSAAHNSQFYEDFLLPHLVPFFILGPISPVFRLTDGQFILALDKIAESLHVLYQKQDGLYTYLKDYFLPRQQLSPELILSYTSALKSNLKDFQLFVRTFYAHFH
ncbi:Exportin-T [Schistosoma japonicum]|uniref:Exportin-T n=1 Tax=Schistosoma japonicum TaxID=6182 RepID=A0A4Z2DCX5_SCHJA|nr:Exportin-T [Schistosoma japonicum]TNN14372.1 Exportin-T [Schistosoma japonicum]